MAVPLFVLNETKKYFHTRKLLDCLPEYEIRRHCGLSGEGVREILPLFAKLEGRRSTAIPLETKVLVFLSYLRSGSFQWCIGSLGGVSQSIACRIIESASSEIVSQLQNYVNFPNSAVELNSFKTKFYEKRRFPNIIGAIDGTHVGLKAPKISECAYINRKNYHSVNVQVTVDPDFCFLDVVAKWPGGAHDSFIWKNSSVRQRLLRGEIGSGWLIGDSGYPLENILLTPYQSKTTNEIEKRYNKVHCATRVVVEQAIGIWKSRFRSMCRTGGLSSYPEQKVCKLVTSSIILHNICRKKGIQLLEEDEHFIDHIIDTEARDFREETASTISAAAIRRNVAENLN